jgi:hypothetical protein
MQLSWQPTSPLYALGLNDGAEQKTKVLSKETPSLRVLSMKFLFAAYCMMNNGSGDSLIGVYKRCLRIGLELHARGHQVAVICPGRHGLRDDTVAAAEQCIQFIDPPLRTYFHSSAIYKRRCLRRVIRDFAPDVVAIGEVPMRGILLDVAVASCELRIPIVILDNACQPLLATKFVKDHGAIADGIALMGPSSLQMKNPPPYYCGIAPFIKLPDEAATRTLNKAWPRSNSVITVLGYERKAEELAISLLGAMPYLPCHVMLISPDILATRTRLERLPVRVQNKIQVMSLPDEALLFETIRRSRLVIGKLGFMQMIESICLGTPFLGLYYRGCFPLWGVPPRMLRVVGQTFSTKATLPVCLRFLRLLYTGQRFIGEVSGSVFSGQSKACDFLEHMVGNLRPGVTEDSSRHGYSVNYVTQALKARHPARPIYVLWIRSAPMWDTTSEKVHLLVVAYRSGQRQQIVVLWGRRFGNRLFARNRGERGLSKSGHRIWFQSPDGTLQIEDERSEDDLPKF